VTKQIYKWIEKAEKDFLKKPGRILEVGSKEVNGVDTPSIRNIFKDAKEYIGLDSERGFGVDKIMDAHDILKVWKPGTFDLVICCEMLEHDPAPWITIEILKKVVKKGGYLIITTPTFGFPLHRHPKDYFRYGEDAYRDFFFTGFKILRLGEVRNEHDAPGICCIGEKI
jgi:SAM-dependent methyltransferase